MGPRRKTVFVQGVEGTLQGSLRIGGVELHPSRVRVAGRGGRGRGRGRGARREEDSSDASSSVDSELQDYLDNMQGNVGGGSGERTNEQGGSDGPGFAQSASPSAAAGAAAAAAAAFADDSDDNPYDDRRLMRAFGRCPVGEMTSSRDGSSDDDSDSDTGGNGKSDATASAFPFYTNKVASSRKKKERDALENSGRKPHQRSVVKGAQGGKLAPGEKKKLRKEKMTAKRAAREGGRGFDAARVARQLAEFAASDGDMMALDTAGKHGLELSLRMARVLQLKASIQGSDSKRLVVVSRTERTHAPSSAALKQLTQLVENEVQQQRKGAVFGGPVGAAGMPLGPPQQQQQQQGGGSRARWQQRASAYEAGGVYARPVAFVAADTTNDAGLDGGMVTHPARAHAGGGGAQHTSEWGVGGSDAASGVERSAGEAGVLRGVEAAAGARVAEDTAHGAAGQAGSSTGAEQTGPDRGSVPIDADPEVSMRDGDSGNEEEKVDEQEEGADESGSGEGGSEEDEEEGGEGEGEEEQQLHVGLGYASNSAAYLFEPMSLSLGLGWEPPVAVPPAAQRSPAVDDVSGTVAALGLGGGDGGGGGGNDPASLLASILLRQSQRAPASGSGRAAPQAVGGPLHYALHPESSHYYQRDDDSDSGSGVDIDMTGSLHGQLQEINRTAQQAKRSGKKQSKDARRQQRQQQWGGDVAPPGGVGIHPPGHGAVAVRAAGPASMALGFAGFERHGTGIGSRLMARMGWVEGAGLGRQQQGRAEPVKASQRPKHLGLGAGATGDHRGD
ncbi:hypothetical protein FOA52_010015 [Chlamydomonas sp. UWO 241]|nr:hypothetical protein FOA52_010015 [Chlamydomonas sp. UWO 241]